MLYLPNADTNDNIEVLNVSDSQKLYSIPNGKRVIMEFNGMLQPMRKSGDKWRQTTSKMVKNNSFVRVSNDWKKVPLEKNERFFEVLMVSVIQ
jgi:hypothetical protein